MNFKEGDKIKRHTEDWGRVVVGGVYTVEESSNTGVLLAEFPDGPWYDAKFFTKVNPFGEEVVEPFGKRFFGYKMRVTPETSEMIQKAVFEAGGSRLTRVDNPFLYIDTHGNVLYGESEEFFVNETMPELIVELEVVKSLKIIDVIPVKTPEELQKEARLKQIKKLEEELAKLKGME